MTTRPLTIPEFIARCDAYCTAANRKRVWLSKRLFNATSRIDDLAADIIDVGVKRLAQAVADLNKLEADRKRDAIANRAEIKAAKAGRDTPEQLSGLAAK